MRNLPVRRSEVAFQVRFLAYLQLAPQQPPPSGFTPALSCLLAKGAGKLRLGNSKLPLTELPRAAAWPPDLEPDLT
jgi:hypothetical protein